MMQLQEQKCVNKPSNIWLLAIPVATLIIVGFVIGNSLIVKAQTPAAPINLFYYKDPKGRFSVLYPVNWTATPQENRFQTQLVKFENSSAAAELLSLGPTGTGTTDPEAFARGAVNPVNHVMPFGFNLFQDVECAKYKMDGQKACSYIFTRQADPDLGTEGKVIMQVISYVKGQMYGMTFVAPQNSFDQILPTFEAMLKSLKFSGTSSSGPTTTNSTSSQ